MIFARNNGKLSSPCHFDMCADCAGKNMLEISLFIPLIKHVGRMWRSLVFTHNNSIFNFSLKRFCFSEF